MKRPFEVGIYENSDTQWVVALQIGDFKDEQQATALAEVLFSYLKDGGSLVKLLEKQDD